MLLTKSMLDWAHQGSAYLLVFVYLLGITSPVCGLYEDQIGKFDWRNRFVGEIRYASFFGSTPNEHIIVATEENVLAALQTKTGDILWRKVLEKGDRGSIRLLHVPTVSSNVDREEDAITVSGSNPALIRGWKGKTGSIEWEWTLTPNSPNVAENVVWFYDQLYLYHVVPVFGSHIEVTAYFASTGQQVKSTTTRISANWIGQDSCVLASNYYVCVVKDRIIGIDLTGEREELLTQILPRDFSGIKPEALAGSDTANIILGDSVYSFGSTNAVLTATETSSIFSTTYSNGNHIIVKALADGDNLHLSSSCLETGANTKDVDAIVPYKEFGTPRIVSAVCKSKSSGPSVCRVLISTEDGAIIMVQQGNIKWTRQESLARIVAIEAMDLPLSDAEGSIENELKNKNGDILGALARRITGQVAHLRNLVLAVLGMGAPQSASQRAGLVRDSFGLHKMLVIVTASGKVFGVDNLSGHHHWVKLLPNFGGFGSEQDMKLLVQRTSGHFPLLAQCTIVARNKINGNGVLYQFNPISGKPITGTGIVSLNYAIEQFSLLHETRSDYLRGILFLDKHLRAHVVPEKATSLVHSFYIYSANKETGIISGYLVEFESGKLHTKRIWQLNLSSSSQKIIQIATKSNIEHVHSQGRVFNDRSVLYKYINPNLVAVATIGPDNIHKYILNVHLIDVVSGGIIFSMAHRRVREPLHIVHSENWLVYTYFNEKVRRTEITTVELYEGKTQANSTVWSSLDAPQLPLVERQSYIIPANVVHMKETITEKGITNKHVLIALSTGSIIEMPWALLDPRRPILLPNQPREEGIIPYIPELQLPSENVINYNQSVTNIRGIHATPSGLESTCLVVVYGLDLFVTRVAPSKTFDLLKEDFDYILISIVLVGLSLASIIVKHLSARKAIKQAWK